MLRDKHSNAHLHLETEQFTANHLEEWVFSVNILFIKTKYILCMKMANKTKFPCPSQ